MFKFCLLFFILPALFAPAVSFGQKIESTIKIGQGRTGGQDVHAKGKSQHGNFTIEWQEDHTTDSTGRVDESQKVTYTDADGKKYSETHWWKYDPFLDEWKEGHRTEGEPPANIPEPEEIADGGVKVEGEANGEPVSSTYGPGGVEDEFPRGERRWVDVTAGESGNLDPAEKSAQEVEGTPARTIPLACHVAGIGGEEALPDGDAQKTAELIAENPEKAEEIIREIMNKAKKMSVGKEKTKPFSMEIRKVPWKFFFRISGYPVDHYQIWSGLPKKLKKRVDIWVIPKINVWSVLKGKNGMREKNVDQLLNPHWEKVNLAQQKKVFSSLTVFFLDSVFDDYYIAQSIQKLPGYSFRRPSVPKDYALEKIDRKTMQKMAKDVLQNFWQQWNP